MLPPFAVGVRAPVPRDARPRTFSIATQARQRMLDLGCAIDVPPQVAVEAL